mgnify:FL=1
MRENTAQIFNIQHFSTEDGPGIRTTVFFQGCPLSCIWCANPESQKEYRQLAHRSSLCIKCGTCIQNCSEKALYAEAGKICIDRKKCIRCGTCTEVCPSHAMFFYGEEKSLNSVFEEVIRDERYYQNSGGGITCSGGECMLQPQFVGGLLKMCKERGIHTAVDTCGYFSTENLKLVLPYTDLMLFDLKHMDPQKHRAYTSQENSLILKNLKEIVQSGIQIFIRIPIIPGYNDSKENLIETAKYVKQLDSSLPVDLLPYHRFGEGKYKMLDIPYKLHSVQAPTEKEMEEYQGIFTQMGLICRKH